MTERATSFPSKGKEEITVTKQALALKDALSHAKNPHPSPVVHPLERGLCAQAPHSTTLAETLAVFLSWADVGAAILFA